MSTLREVGEWIEQAERRGRVQGVVVSLLTGIAGALILAACLVHGVWR